MCISIHVEEAINTISKDRNSATTRIINIDGVEVGYKAVQTVDNKISISTYYPYPK